jgi:hypothetical protein
MTTPAVKKPEDDKAAGRFVADDLREFEFFDLPEAEEPQPAEATESERSNWLDLPSWRDYP